LKDPKIRGKFPKTFWNVVTPNKAFGALEKMFWSIKKLDCAHRKVKRSSEIARKILRSLEI
jgi:hypothetical protein